jgi:hypothetical protein
MFFFRMQDLLRSAVQRIVFPPITGMMTTAD